jgi:hypothetical protein
MAAGKVPMDGSIYPGALVKVRASGVYVYPALEVKQGSPHRIAWRHDKRETWAAGQLAVVVAVVGEGYAYVVGASGSGWVGISHLEIATDS